MQEYNYTPPAPLEYKRDAYDDVVEFIAKYWKTPFRAIAWAATGEWMCRDRWWESNEKE